MMIHWKYVMAKATEAHHATLRRMGIKCCGVCKEAL